MAVSNGFLIDLDSKDVNNNKEIPVWDTVGPGMRGLTVLRDLLTSLWCYHAVAKPPQSHSSYLWRPDEGLSILEQKNNLHKLLDDVWCFNFISVWNSLAFLLLTNILTWRKYTWWILPTDTTFGENYWNSVLVPGIDCIEEKIELSLLFSLIQSSTLYLISLLLYRWIRLGKDFLRKRFQNGPLVSS